MDVLSAVLRELRFASAAYRWLELGAPFAVGFDRAGLRGVHIVDRGRCELVLADGTVTALSAGDVVILPRGDPHVLRAGAAAVAVSGFELAMRDPAARIVAGGPGERTVVVCGAFVVG